MDEIIDAIAYQYAHDYGRNVVEREALYAILTSKLHKAKANWKQLSTFGTYMKSVAYKAVLDYIEISQAKPLESLANDIADIVMENHGEGGIESKQHIKIMLEELRNNTSSGEYEVICRTFGIGGFDKSTKKEIYDNTYYTVGEQLVILRSVFGRLRTNKVIYELYKAL